MQWLFLVWIGLFSYLIINWIFNRQSGRIIEGATNAAAKSDKTDAGSKCPEDCTSVKELQKKLSDAMKKVDLLESDIDKNTTESAQHSKAITDMNKAITDMQSKGKDE
jgi:peptidoglycan hydrolase CwlO-like protein